MESQYSETANALVIRQHFRRSSREQVFAAWTSPEALKRWFGPVGCECADARVELRIGGLFYLELRAGGQAWSVSGRFVDIVPPERIVMAWRWSGTPADDDYESVLNV